jgi:hypothetical protein
MLKKTITFMLLFISTGIGSQSKAIIPIEMPINTGLNHQQGMFTQPYTGVPAFSTLSNISDNYWTVFWHNDANLPPGPFLARVIGKFPTWQNPQSSGVGGFTYGSHWISAYQSAENYRPKYYVFRTCFCLQEGFQRANFQLSMLHDDTIAGVWLGNKVGGSDVYYQVTNSSFPTANASGGNSSRVSYADSKFKVGRNCIYVVLRNLANNKLMGLNVVGKVAAIGLLPTPGSGVNGNVFQACNCSGVALPRAGIMPDEKEDTKNFVDEIVNKLPKEPQQ